MLLFNKVPLQKLLYRNDSSSKEEGHDGLVTLTEYHST